MESKWIPEIRKHSVDTPIILVGTKSDLKPEENIKNPLKNAMEVAEAVGIDTYLECSSLSGIGVKNVFEVAVRAVFARTKAKSVRRDIYECATSICSII